MYKTTRTVLLLIGVFIFAAQAHSIQTSSSSMAGVEAQPLEPSRPVERELKAKQTHAYQVVLEAGQFLEATVDQRGIDVMVRVVAPDGSEIAEIDSPNGADGDEPIALEARATGTYRIEVSPLGMRAPWTGRYEIRVDRILTAETYAERRAEKKRKRQPVIAWLKEHVIPLRTTEPGSGFDDLQPLKQVFRDVRFVGLGEATHGTHEFFRFKHRMLEFLVEEMGFRVFAIEASYAACQNINDYVMGRTDDGAAVLASQRFWTWDTEEVRAMMDWMRRYNAGVAAGRKVKFVGFDFRYNEPGKARLLEYMKRLAPERVAATEALFKVDFAELFGTALEDIPGSKEEAKAEIEEIQDKYNGLYVFLDLHGAELAAKSNQAEYEQMREYARIIAQIASVLNACGYSGRREYA